MRARRADIEPSVRRVRREARGRSCRAGRFVHDRRRRSPLPRRCVAWRCNPGQWLRAMPTASVRRSIRHTSRIARRERMPQPVRRTAIASSPSLRNQSARATVTTGAYASERGAPLRSRRRRSRSMIPQSAVLAVPNTCANASTTSHSLPHRPGFTSRCATVARSKATVSHTGIGSNEAATRGASLHRQNRQIAIAACQPGDTGNTTRIAARRPPRIEMRAAPNDASPLHCRAR
ncbi:hypothetical protein BAN20980_04552 [Burkholderia anthina]|uniref:Uncharacterized protein n=1 Tax=Burkholderia anthina TaxID=179879 RepID=A0A6P2GDH6_9BURK|nr:hypothetical protein BAN20980_04552 [Burkholderia anthina]